ncbi:MAG: PEP-CTERM sorting domain-containing protein [Phycisphaerales bacterium]|nr:PEP-CTERM sorting domain-containing protein [Phycisphaerales bacterium]
MFTNHALIIAASAAIASTAVASDPQFVLSDRNSSATFDVNNGQISWEVDGVSQLFAQEFYFRRANDTSERLLSAENLSLDGIFTTDTNPFRDDSDDALSQLFSDDAGLQIETIFTLRGGSDGSSRADLAEQIVIRNLSQETMSISFFQFVDFDLGGDAGDDAGQIMSGNTVSQSDDGFSVSETVVTPQPNFFQVGDADEISAMLNDDQVDSLDNTASFAGNVGWSFQWDITLGAGEAFIITKDKSIVPSPGSFALLGLAGALVTRRRR